jgi:hypothetical protein
MEKTLPQQKTIELLQTYMKKFKFLNKNIDYNIEFKWTDVYFGFKESQFEYNPDSKVEFDIQKKDWDEECQKLNFWDLKHNDKILSLEFNSKSYLITNPSRSYGSSSGKETFKYDRINGFHYILADMKIITLQNELHLTYEETKLLNSTFENELGVKEALDFKENKENIIKEPIIYIRKR